MSGNLPQRFGSYMLLKRLGAGGGGDVHLAKSLDRQTGPSTVVVKRLHENLVERSEFVSRFRHEAELAAAIDDPHVAKVYDAGELDGVLYIVMEYIPGWPLSRVLRDLSQAQTLPPLSAALALGESALLGLGALHDAKKDGQKLGIIHRDIAPKNIMLRADGEACLIDLGIGKSRLQDWKTRTGFVMGSPGYMAPEHATAKAIDHRADLYAMAIVIWELLTLSTFVPGTTAAAKMMAVARGNYVAPSTVRADISPALDAVFAKALAREPEARFASAAELIAALRAALPDRKISAEWFAEKMPGEELEREETEVRALVTADVTLPLPLAGESAASRGEIPSRMPYALAGGALALAAAGLFFVYTRPDVEPTTKAVLPPPVEVSPRVQVVAREKVIPAVVAVEAKVPEHLPEETKAAAEDPVPRIRSKKSTSAVAEKPQRESTPKLQRSPKERLLELKARARRLRTEASGSARAGIEDVITALMLIDENAGHDRLDELQEKLDDLSR